MHRVMFWLALVVCLAQAEAQPRFSVSGMVRDGDSGEMLIGATVIVPSLGIGTTTNEYGFYSISLPAGDSVEIEFRYVGFQTQIRTLLLQRDDTLDVELGTGIQLQEVIIKANSFEEQLKSTEMSVEVVTTREARLLPVLLGESDIIKTIQLKPGIPSGAEGTTGLFVRGGGADQNLIVLDEAIVYNANHLFGFFSTFNTDAVKDLKIFKGGFPAQYGGRLSSVIDVKLKEGNNKKFAGSGGLGLISSRLTLEGPIQKDRSSFMVSGRRTYVDLFTRQVNRANEGKPDFNPIPDYYFYDLNTKLNYQLGEKDRLFLSGYFGRDVFGFDGDFFNFNFDWGNATGTLRWNHLFNPRLFANTTLTFSNYEYNIENRLTGFSFLVSSNIRDANWKTDLYYTIDNRHTFRFGASATLHWFSVGRLRAGSTDGVVNFSAGQDFRGSEWGIYFTDEWAPHPRWKLNGGLRLSGFRNSRSYAGLEPRMSVRYALSDRWSFKGSYARMFQYLHLVANAGITLPTDIWYPSTERVRPQRSDQAALGASYLLGKKYFINVETYYKWLTNQLEFVDGAELFANDELENEFAIGKGRGYGLEISIEKEEGKLTGWIGYTLALIQRGEFNPLDPSQRFLQKGYFSPVYDRRHDLSVVGMYQLSRRLTASATFVYGSGDLRWLPTGRFTFQDVYGADFESVIPDYSGGRNNFRLPPYHRLDIGLTIHFLPKWGESDLVFNIINAYDRRNTFFIYLEPEFQQADTGTGIINFPKRIAARQVSLFPVLPSISWNFKF